MSSEDEQSQRATADTPARRVITAYGVDLAIEAQRAKRIWWGLLIASLILALVVLLGAPLGAPSYIPSLALIAGIASFFYLMRASDEVRDLAAEKLDFDRPEVFGFDVDADLSDEAADARLYRLSREIVLRKRLRITRNRARYTEASGIVLGSLAITLLVWLGFSLEDFLREYHGGDRYSLEELYEYELEVVSIGLIALLLTGWGITRFRSAKSARLEYNRLEVEQEILPVEEQPDAARSRKLLLINQRNLESYYSINRFNSRVTITVAVFCVIAGLGITLWTIQAVIGSTATEAGSKVVIAGVGAANAIMVNVVAAIVLRIQATISSNVNAFHDRLVRSHDIFLANVIAAEIDDDQIRRETLASIAKAIGLRGATKSAAPPKKDSAKPSKKPPQEPEADAGAEED